MPTLGCVEIVRYKAIVEEIFQARIPKYEFLPRRGPRPALLQLNTSDDGEPAGEELTTPISLHHAPRQEVNGSASYVYVSSFFHSSPPRQSFLDDTNRLA